MSIQQSYSSAFGEAKQAWCACKGVQGRRFVHSKLQLQKKKQLPANLPKGEFQLVSVLNDGVGVALYKFSDTAACRDVSSTNHRHLPTPNQPPIHLSLTLPLQLGINLGHGIVYWTDVKWEVVSGNIITIDATPPEESASYETQQTVNLVFKLKQLPALQSVCIIPASGHVVEEFCPFSGGGDVYMFDKDLVVVLLTVEEDKDNDDNDYEDDNPSPQAQQEKENTPVPPPLKRELRCSGIENVGNVW